MRICCRRTPCGEGSKTWDNWEMTVFKRYIDLECTAAQMKEVTSITIPSGVEINVDFRQSAWSSCRYLIIYSIFFHPNTCFFTFFNLLFYSLLFTLFCIFIIFLPNFITHLKLDRRQTIELILVILFSLQHKKLLLIYFWTSYLFLLIQKSLKGNGQKF